MKAVVINETQELKEIIVDSFEVIYRKCGYRSENNFMCLASEAFSDGSTILEYWGKKCKGGGYNYRGHTLYSKCAIVLRRDNEIIDLTIDEYNEITLFGANGDLQEEQGQEEEQGEEQGQEEQGEEEQGEDDKQNRLKVEQPKLARQELQQVISGELVAEDYVYTSDECEE